MSPAPGTVYLVGAGPGDPELITVRGLRLLRGADVVIHDRLIARELLQESGTDAEVIDARQVFGCGADAQARINASMIEAAHAGQSVVRLKSGDPVIFGRGGEELIACREAGVNCVIVPGVTSAIAVPATVGIPITHRDVSRSFAVVTAHISDHADSAQTDYRALIGIDTVIIMMGRSNLADTTRKLMAAGWPVDTPAACIERGTTPEQRVTRATLESIAPAADRDNLHAPAITIVGPTVALLNEVILNETVGGTRHV